MKSVVDTLWYLLLAIVIFFVGVTYQWIFTNYPRYPFTIFSTTLDNAKDGVAETLRILGMRKPSYYFETGFTAEDNFVDPARAQAGLTLVTRAAENDRLTAEIIDHNGEVVQRWDTDWFTIWPDAEHVPEIFIPKRTPGTHVHGAVVLEDGDLVFNFEYLGLVRLDVCGDAVWRLPYQTHHSVYTDPDSGNLWVSGRIFHETRVPELPNHVPTFAEPTVLEVTQDGEILREISVFDVLRKNDLEGLMLLLDFGSIVNNDAKTAGDTLHLNDVEVFPSHLPSGHFKPGDIMLSLREAHTVLVFDPDSLEISFIKTGHTIGQHDPDFIDGNRISVFDNHVAGDPKNGQQSRIVMFDASTDEQETFYEGTPGSPFYTDKMGKQQWLENGNLLITESYKGRAFEVTPEGDIVWQLVNLLSEAGWIGLVDEAQRLPASMDKRFFEQQQQACAATS